MNDFKPNVLSDILLDDFVLKKDVNYIYRIDLRWVSFDGFDEHVLLYKIALVLLALLNIENVTPAYHQVRSLFEKAVFMNDNTPKLPSYHQVKSAMINLKKLLDTSNRHIDNLRDQNEKIPWISRWVRKAKVLEHDRAILPVRLSVETFGWAMAWLGDIGIIETTPATLDLLSSTWIGDYSALKTFLKDCNLIL
jgi:hypothetical protein